MREDDHPSEPPRGLDLGGAAASRVLDALPSTALDALVAGCEESALPAGATVGALAWGDDALFVRSGAVRFERAVGARHEPLAAAEAGDLVVPFGAARPPRVVTDDGATLVRVPSPALTHARRRYPAFDREVARAEERSTTAWLLAGCRLFAPLRAAERGALAEHAIHRRLSLGEALVRRGDQPDGVFMVLQGEIGVTDPDEPPERLAAPGCLGVMHCLGQVAAPVDAVARSAVEVCFFDAAALFPLLFDELLWAAFERASRRGYVLQRCG